MSVEEKLKNGDDMLSKAGHDRKLYSVSLLAYHGALEDFFREELGAALSDFERYQKNNEKAGWVDLVNLWQQKRGSLGQDRNTILSKNAIRQSTAHGNFIEVERHEAEQYARFVKDFIRKNATYPSKYQIPTARSTTTAPPPPVSSARPVQPPKTPTQQSASQPVQSYAARSSPTVLPPKKTGRSRKRWIWGLLFIVFLLLACWPLLVSAEWFDGLLSSIWSTGETMQEEARKLAPIFDVVIPSAESVTPANGLEETAVPAPGVSEGESTAGETAVRVVGNSYVRAGPGQDTEIVGTAMNAEVYTVLETSADGQWYKIKLDSGREGWLGSTRATQVSP